MVCVTIDSRERAEAAFLIAVLHAHPCQIPYSCEVLIVKYKERKAETVLDASIVVSQDSQKAIVIGKGGSKIKEVGIRARNVSCTTHD